MSELDAPRPAPAAARPADDGRGLGAPAREGLRDDRRVRAAPEDAGAADRGGGAGRRAGRARGDVAPDPARARTAGRTCWSSARRRRSQTRAAPSSPSTGSIPSPGAHASGPRAPSSSAQTVAPPLVACARGAYEESVSVTVFPALPGSTCAELGYDAVPPAFAEQAQRFSQVQDALAALPVDDGCVSFGDARDVADRALTGAGLTDWEVARDGSFDGDDSCLQLLGLRFRPAAPVPLRHRLNARASGICTHVANFAGNSAVAARLGGSDARRIRLARRLASVARARDGARHSAPGRRASRAADRLRIRKEHESCDSALRCWSSAAPRRWRSSPRPPATSPRTLETLPASQADDRLADLGVPASDIAEAVEVLDEARSDPAAEVVGRRRGRGWSSSARWRWRLPAGRTCLWETPPTGGDDQLRRRHGSTSARPAGSTAPRRGPTSGPATRSSARPAPRATGPPRASCACRRTPRPPRWAGWDNAADLVRLSTSSATC